LNVTPFKDKPHDDDDVPLDTKGIFDQTTLECIGCAPVGPKRVHDIKLSCIRNRPTFTKLHDRRIYYESESGFLNRIIL